MKRVYMLVLALIIVFALPALADTVTLTFTDVGPGYSNGSYYTYPYNLYLSGNPIFQVI